MPIPTSAPVTRTSFTPTLPLNQWRIYRIRATGTEWTAYLDQAVQKTLTGTAAAIGWSAGAWIGRTNDRWFFGNIAELLIVKRPLTNQEVTNLVRYLNTEHGLNVPTS